MSDPAEIYFEEEKHWTYADYKNWELKAGERYEVLNGIAYAMSAPNDAHQAISVELTMQIASFLHGQICKIRVAPYDVRLYYEEDESDDTIVQPDISVICDPKKRGTEGCRGAPDFVIEILSPSNTSEDTIRKFNLYMDAGVREYWIVAPETKTVFVYQFEGGGIKSKAVYENAAPAAAAESGSQPAVAVHPVYAPVEAIEGLTINLTDVFAGL
ncbi:hypothetical protein AGMMS50212_03480 [Spirochaetia bacterium]|nr:hypothetical protein AGMMS50212_03480 [Spirochaetia bacterium]